MSGGRWQYQDSCLKNDMFNYSGTSDPMEDKEVSKLVYDVFNLIHDLDWYKSDDTGEEDYIKAKKKFKEKWLRNKNYNKNVLQPIIEEEIELLKEELVKMIE